MSSPVWNLEPQETPEDYDEDINDYQPENSNPHISRSNDFVGEGDLDDMLDSATSSFESEEVSKADLYWNAASASERLAEVYEEEGLYLMADIGPEGASAVAVGGEDRVIIGVRYSPNELDSIFSPTELLDNTEYANELFPQIMDFDLADLSYRQMDEIDDVWEVEPHKMEDLSERIIVAPGLEEEYREMAESQIERHF